MVSYPRRVKRDIERWREAGLVDEKMATTLSLDIERNSGSRVSFGTVLTMMAAALFAAAILIFIAANWEEIPRLVRVGLLMALILGGYIGGALFKLRGHEAAGEASWLVAAAGFGASIALIAQIYHMTGDESQAVLVWGSGVALAAAALRSGPLTAGAVLLAGAWMVMAATDGRGLVPPLSWLAMAGVLYLLSFWTSSRLARHLLFFSLYLFVFLFHLAHEESLIAPVALVGVAIILFGFALLRPERAQQLSGLSQEALTIQALLGFLAGVGIMQLTSVDEPELIPVTVVALGGIVAALLLAGRDNRLLRWFAYIAFACQLCFLYIVMLGTMLDTAGFFMVAGLMLSALAFLISRLERAVLVSRQAGEEVSS